MIMHAGFARLQVIVRPTVHGLRDNTAAANSQASFTLEHWLTITMLTNVTVCELNAHLGSV